MDVRGTGDVYSDKALLKSAWKNSYLLLLAYVARHLLRTAQQLAQGFLGRLTSLCALISSLVSLEILSPPTAKSKGFNQNFQMVEVTSRPHSR